MILCVCECVFVNIWTWWNFHKRWEECNFYWFFSILFYLYVFNFSIPQPQKKGHKIHNNNWFIFYLYYLFIYSKCCSFSNWRLFWMFSRAYKSKIAYQNIWSFVGIVNWNENTVYSEISLFCSSFALQLT